MIQRGLRVIVSESTDAILNLATEEWLFRDAPIAAQTLYLWRNDKVRRSERAIGLLRRVLNLVLFSIFQSVIVGRNQNVWKECHVDAMESLGVQLARRGSGGGAVKINVIAINLSSAHDDHL